ncbi:MAG: hypothetical protein RL088_1629 [Verrucomicrobiota bacterium]|jgi:hypothetical protein
MKPRAMSSSCARSGALNHLRNPRNLRIKIIHFNITRPRHPFRSKNIANRSESGSLIHEKSRREVLKRTFLEPIWTSEGESRSFFGLRRSSELLLRSSEHQRRSSDLRRRSSNLQRRSANLRRRSSNLRRRSSNLRRRSPNLRRRSPNLRRRSPNLRRRSSNLRRRSPNLRRPTGTMWKSPSPSQKASRAAA